MALVLVCIGCLVIVLGLYAVAVDALAEWDDRFNILHIGRITRLYSLDCGNYSGGETRQFWFKKKAIACFERVSGGYLHVELRNNLTKESTDLKNEYNKYDFIQTPSGPALQRRK